MNITYRNVVSRAQNDLNSLNKDMFIPRRLILSIFKSKAETYLLQKLNEKKLFDDDSLFEWINCIKMEEVSPDNCGVSDFSSCNTVMRSKKKLPGIMKTDYGYAVVLATNADHSKEYKVRNFTGFSTLKKGRFYNKFKGKYLYILNDYLYAPDSTIKIFNLFALTLDESSIDNDCEDTAGETSEDSTSSGCKSYWDKEIDVPKKLYDLMFQETLRELTIRIGIPKDENPNLDSNIKSQSVQ